MKRFIWPLQRLLDVAAQRETLARAALGEAIAAQRRVMQRRAAAQASLDALLSEMREIPLERRLQDRAMYDGFLAFQTRRLRELDERVEEARRRREQELTALREIRRNRRMLERLRAQAWGRYRVELDRQEQKQLDESATAAFARRALRGADRSIHG